MSGNESGKSGKILVISMLAGAVILAMVALRFRRFPPTQAPSSQPATLAATASGPMN